MAVGRKTKFSGLQIVGVPKTIGAQTVQVILADASDKILFCTGLTLPSNAGSGYAKGCLFIDTDVAGGTSGLYVNVGTPTSCTFQLVTSV